MPRVIPSFANNRKRGPIGRIRIPRVGMIPHKLNHGSPQGFGSTNPEFSLHRAKC
jgi:hypothetical protein